VFARQEDRAAIEATAAAAHVPFAGLWLDAPADILVSRAGSRGPDVSDADAQVVRRQLAQDIGPLTWHRLDASPAPDVVIARALTTVLDETGPSCPST
jgi:predicted kinase